ncbi:RadC family protein [Gynuella sunshinyii]|uniref:DNA repair protein n=1 Tax=Gynuella sunshinyii YC6258 TaxID=1445510 RepID=A0A0C5VS84_9GAMM|nr:DNA repair protein RadC [Gynuella sunshinyii]AJQ93134.1 DNA repair protein [Gynuella sunshinyii YC6258]
MTIRDWPENERPREKLLARGAAALSDAELLAIFLRTGVKGLSAVDLSRQLLNGFGGLRVLMGADQQQFCSHKGLGQAKYVQLQAVLEMARRHAGEMLQREDVFDSTDATRTYLLHHLRDTPHEEFHVLFLDNQHRLLKHQCLFTGTLDGASVYPREVVKRVLSHNAAAVIFAHNHPSGVAEPSPADIAITRRLKEALALVDVRVLDHQIIGDGYVTSLAQKGLL